MARRRRCGGLDIYGILLSERFLARLDILHGFGIRHCPRSVLILCRKAALFRCKLRLEIADDRLVFLANECQTLGRCGADLLGRGRRGSAAQMILGEQEAADHACQRGG